jgi:hypothetical protein
MKKLAEILKKIKDKKIEIEDKIFFYVWNRAEDRKWQQYKEEYLEK